MVHSNAKWIPAFAGMAILSFVAQAIHLPRQKPHEYGEALG